MKKLFLAFLSIMLLNSANMFGMGNITAQDDNGHRRQTARRSAPTQKPRVQEPGAKDLTQDIATELKSEDTESTNLLINDFCSPSANPSTMLPTAVPVQASTLRKAAKWMIPAALGAIFTAILAKKYAKSKDVKKTEDESVNPAQEPIYSDEDLKIVVNGVKRTLETNPNFNIFELAADVTNENYSEIIEFKKAFYKETALQWLPSLQGKLSDLINEAIIVVSIKEYKTLIQKYKSLKKNQSNKTASKKEIIISASLAILIIGGAIVLPVLIPIASGFINRPQPVKTCNEILGNGYSYECCDASCFDWESGEPCRREALCKRLHCSDYNRCLESMDLSPRNKITTETFGQTDVALDQTDVTQDPTDVTQDTANWADRILGLPGINIVSRHLKKSGLNETKF